MIKYNSIEEALTELSKRFKELEKVFCPLINAQCVFSCVCFNKPCIYEKTFNVYQGGCSNKMFRNFNETGL